MGNRDNKELRNHERFHFREAISIDGTRCMSMDISESGIYVEAQYFKTGDIVDITVPFRDRTITLKGQVQHCESGYGAGISFTDVDDDNRAILKQLILSISNIPGPDAMKVAKNGSDTSFSMYKKDAILDALITLLHTKQIISHEELLSELKKPIGNRVK